MMRYTITCPRAPDSRADSARSQEIGAALANLLLLPPPLLLLEKGTRLGEHRRLCADREAFLLGRRVGARRVPALLHAPCAPLRRTRPPAHAEHRWPDEIIGDASLRGRARRADHT